MRRFTVLQIAAFFFVGVFVLYSLRGYGQPTEEDLVCAAGSSSCTAPRRAAEVSPERSSYPFTLVTGASANHFCSLESFLYALHELKPLVHPWEFPRIVVYNIGLNRTQLPVLQQLRSSGLADEAHTFDYSRYPAFWNLHRARGQYAWKAGIVDEVRKNHGGVIVWLDSGDMPNPEFLRIMPRYIRDHGFWSPRSTGTMDQWVHPGMFEYFDANKAQYADKANCNGAALGFDSDNEKIVNELMVPWVECALKKECIAPKGSRRGNHRQDQAAITFLAYKHGYVCSESARFHGVMTHEDESCAYRLTELEKQGKLLHPSTYDMPVWTFDDTKAFFEHSEWANPDAE
ncbi:hypothetical protein BC938DRAFT_483088 [Jimgerdemannia flammicorona]|uniref:Uncharacterized protein n=1 Tax=Jimgerdemannia flammicorona TaxID=994334 RepID=A0A433QCL0_9FUNG|nr:hypothetical protein BC938DRAFT_483088 [Jimgerdemannia flammicorona]